MHNDGVRPTLAADFPAFSVVRPKATRPVLLVCDHASSAVPHGLGDLGLPRHEVERHIGWDIGAAEVTRALAENLGATAVLSGVSRLVVDCNRSLDDPTLIPAVSDGVSVPGNQSVAARERDARIEAWFQPYHAAIGRELARLESPNRAATLISIHSFTPHMNGSARPWPVGVLWNRDPRLAVPVIEALRSRGHHVGDNEPYSGRTGAHTVDTHAAGHGRPHVTLEIRQDLIADTSGARRWANLIAEVLHPILQQEATVAWRKY